MDLFRLGVTASVLAVGLTAAVCTGNRNAHEGAPITVAGCLQKGDAGGDYLLTQVNRPSSDIPASGASNATQIAREESRAASHTFRLTGQEDQLKLLVGKQVEISSTTLQGSDVWRKVRDANQDSTKGEAIPPEIKEGDLAKIDVTSIQQVADVCGEPRRTASK